MDKHLVNTTSDFEIPRVLLEALERREVVLFLGRGLAEELEKPFDMLSDRRMARELADRCNYSGPDESLSAIAGFYERRNDTQALREFLREYILEVTKNGSVPPPRLYKVIAGLPFAAIVTTNYDDALQEALRKCGKPHTLVFDDSILPYHQRDKIPLIYLCGRYDRPDKLRITKKDLSQLQSSEAYRESEKINWVMDFLENHLRTTRLLFIGFSPSDNFFMDFYDNAIFDLKDSVSSAYIFTKDTGVVEDLWPTPGRLEAIPIAAQDGLLALQSAWLKRRVQAPSPNFTSGESSVMGPSFRCFGKNRDENLELVLASLAQRLDLKDQGHMYKKVTAHSLVSLTQDAIAADLILFDLRSNLPELWTLLGVSIVLNRKCFVLTTEEQIPFLEKLTGIGHVSHLKGLESELLRWWKNIDETEEVSAFLMPKLGAGVLIDWMQEHEEGYEKRLRALLDKRLQVERLPAEGSIDRLSRDFHPAELVVIRADEASHMPYVCIQLGMALGVGASVILASDSFGFAPEFTDGAAPFFFQIPPTFEDVLDEDTNKFCERLLDYPLLNGVIKEVECLIGDNKLRMAWALCNRLVYAVPHFALAYDKRAKIYELCDQTDEARRQYLLALDLNPDSLSAESYFQLQTQAVEQAFLSNRFEEVKKLARQLLRLNEGSLGLNQRLENWFNKLTEAVQEKSDLETTATFIDVFRGYQNISENVADRFDDLEREVEGRLDSLRHTIGPALVHRSDKKTSSSRLLENDKFWGKLDSMMASYHNRTFSGVRQVSDLRMRLKEAQEKLQEIPRLRQQVRDYKSSKRKLQEDLRQLKEKHKHLEVEIANITDAREKARKDLEASRKKVQKERERAWYFKSILLTTIPILFIFVLSLLLMSIRENLRGLGFDWKDWWLIPSVLVLPTLGVIWWQIRHFSVSKTSGRSVSNLPRKPRKR